MIHTVTHRFVLIVNKAEPKSEIAAGLGDEPVSAVQMLKSVGRRRPQRCDGDSSCYCWVQGKTELNRKTQGEKGGKWATEITVTGEGRWSIVSSLTLGRRISKQCSPTLVCVGIAGDPPKTKSGSAGLGWGLVFCTSCLCDFLLSLLT